MARVRIIATCAWMASCRNDAFGVVDHPTLGYVPTCDACIARFDLPAIPVRFVGFDGTNDTAQAFSTETYERLEPVATFEGRPA